MQPLKSQLDSTGKIMVSSGIIFLLAFGILKKFQSFDFFVPFCLVILHFISSANIKIATGKNTL